MPVAFKWASNPADALRLVQKNHAGKKRRGAVLYDDPVAESIQAFSDEGRAATTAFWANQSARAAATVAEVELFARDAADEIGLSDEHDLAE